MSTVRRGVVIAMIAILGISIAAFVTWGTSQLVSQRIGLASEPLTAGRRLLPPLGASAAPGSATRSQQGSRSSRARGRSGLKSPAVTTPAPGAVGTPAGATGSETGAQGRAQPAPEAPGTGESDVHGERRTPNAGRDD